MIVPKSKRKQSKFEAAHLLNKLRMEVTNLASMQFGFDADKYEKSIQRYAENHKQAANVDEVVERYRRKKEAFIKWFIPEERKAVIDLAREITKEFSIGNAIFPTRDNPARIEEYNARRIHMDNAIAYCFALKQEIHYVMETLPVDMNKFCRFADMIDREIALIKGVRKADNRFLGKKKKSKEKEDNSEQG